MNAVEIKEINTTRSRRVINCLTYKGEEQKGMKEQTSQTPGQKKKKKKKKRRRRRRRRLGVTEEESEELDGYKTGVYGVLLQPRLTSGRPPPSGRKSPPVKQTSARTVRLLTARNSTPGTRHRVLQSRFL
ncbi:hypothetical protein F2P81_018132 [Scophthalmus maximus]|uniref:Uncharacterized protein n=1 Tax=Scophthalmus maximus TaxID=52904 RepID=A0A6A4S7E2_SCOMX|nr:hypothetical protein F2P81_018132 [Scophthalmus maximus]